MENEPHASLGPLLFLLGRWEGAGVGGYPTIESFRFGQEISFSHNGKPYLIYSSRTWLLDDAGNIGRPSAKEVTAGRRLYGLIGADLGYAYDMAAVGQPLQAHLSAQLKRTGDAG